MPKRFVSRAYSSTGSIWTSWRIMAAVILLYVDLETPGTCPRCFFVFCSKNGSYNFRNDISWSVMTIDMFADSFCDSRSCLACISGISETPGTVSLEFSWARSANRSESRIHVFFSWFRILEYCRKTIKFGKGAHMWSFHGRKSSKKTSGTTCLSRLFFRKREQRRAGDRIHGSDLMVGVQ